MRFNRRHFLKVSGLGVGALTLPLDTWASEPTGEPHFFLKVFVENGVDPLFMFDGRPLKMTEAGWIHDHVREEPELWTGVNGGQCLTTRHARKLAEFRDHFSIVNGVFMATAFDGHPQNINFLFTGNPFGGESYVAHLNDREGDYQARPLDALQFGVFPLDQTNGGSTVPLTLDSAYKLIEFLKKARRIDERQRVIDYVTSRMRAIGQGAGRFSGGSRKMGEGYVQAPELADRLKKVRIEKPESYGYPEHGFIDLMAGCFRHNVCSSALIHVLPNRYSLDVHGVEMARFQVEMYDSVSEKLLRIIRLLRDTPFDETRSLLDVTTVMVASEFGRTLRQPNLALSETGTDHNTVNNSILLGGKGIRGGLIINESDWRTPDEALSKAHLTVDADRLKVMGRPFDFTTGRPRFDLPSEFNLSDYLTVASVINTVYSAFNVPRRYWRSAVRDGDPAPCLTQLI